MRVLWFSVTPSLFNPYSNTHNGGGWIASLEQIVRGMPEIELGVSFYFRTDCGVYENDGVKYYTLPNDSRGTLANGGNRRKRKREWPGILKLLMILSLTSFRYSVAKMISDSYVTKLMSR